MPVEPINSFFAFLATSSGSINMNAAGSSLSSAGGGAVRFYAQPASSEGNSLLLERINFSMTAPGPFLWNGFGGGSALTNGLKVEILSTDGTTVLHDFLGGQTLQQNHHWTLLAGTDNTVAAGTSAGATYHKGVRWTVSRAGGPIQIAQGCSLCVTVLDDVSSSGVFTQFRALAQGQYEG